MDFPLYHLDFLGNRLLIAIVAITHVVITHALAVGGMLIIACMERKGLYDPEWDRFAKKTLFSFFLITTTVGAMTGVGIWFSASLVNPTSIASLIRVFFWAWFTEWICFVTEVILILYYYLTWDKWVNDRKRGHVRLGFNLALTSWLTMAIIVAILAFMMDPGNWLTDKSFLSGFVNPIYLPQLAFRTPLAMVMAGGSTFLVLAFTQVSDDFRKKATKFISKWILAWLPFLGLGSYWYLQAIPDSMRANFNVALTTQEFTSWYKGVLYTIVIAILFVLLLTLKGIKTGRLSKAVMVTPFIIFIIFMGQFERSREFIRKPYVIGNYLYANGFRKDDYPLLQRDGILKHAPYVSIREITEQNKLAAGREVFNLTCTRCHTVNGVNSVVTKLSHMYGSNPWNVETITNYLAVMHQTRIFMPPFPGNEKERQALAKYLISLQYSQEPFEGVQVIGISTEEDKKETR
ncbi:c-type cytochrome [Pseudobdellovibrio exovorus]|uniref:Cytochrome c domain-containing protein n=1 Tax=Pseudobdellovibrio exovorus JSS TaxID=1184267 RepID=M4VP12_9BACT|nr:cytochrome c [Pseudobdellovibrio exovorus]AGH94869.1 hypothetical protein A11Q_649 [Pseudobdellovibrio exovorus JSS]